MSFKRPCLQPGCPQLVTKGRCPQHAKKARDNYDTYRGSARKRGYDATWDKVSRTYRRKHPTCEDCKARGITAPVALVHHVVPLDQGGARLDHANLRSMCDACHQATHAELQR